MARLFIKARIIKAHSTRGLAVALAVVAALAAAKGHPALPEGFFDGPG